MEKEDVCGWCYCCLYCLSLVCVPIILGLALSSDSHTTEYTSTGTFGDSLNKSSGLFNVSSTVASVTVTLFSYDDVSVITFTTVSEPPLSSVLLPSKILSTLSNDNRVSYVDYNYIATDKPIYLLPGSIIFYNASVVSTAATSARYSACIYLFDDTSSFADFKSGYLIDSIDYICLPPVSRIIDHSISFNITNDGTYYVGIELIQSYITITSAVSVLHVYYNTTGLQPQLTCTDDTLLQWLGDCSVTICNSFSCADTMTYLLIQPSDSASLSLYYTTHAPFYLNTTKLGLFCTTLILYLCCYVCYCTFCCLYIICCDQDSVQQELPNRNIRSASNSKSDEMALLNSTEENELDSNSIQSTSTNSLPDFNLRPSSIEDTIDQRLFSVCNVTNLASTPTLPEFINAVDECNLKSYEEDIKPNTILHDIKSIFNEVIELTVDSNGCVYRCSQYGVTLIIPKGAVQQPTTVWYGACLFSDKFKFEGDYIPVSPIVWIYIDSQLKKPALAELYMPHHIDTTHMSDLAVGRQLLLLTAEDGEYIKKGHFSFKHNLTFQVKVDSTVAKITASHFCSNCIATYGRNHRTIPKRYLIARADKKEQNNTTHLVDFTFLYAQRGCSKIVEVQNAKEGYTQVSYTPVTLTGDRRVSLSFDPSHISGWNRTFRGFCQEYISEESIDYYQMMGCERGIVTQENIDCLDCMEDLLSYPPRFRLKFTLDSTVDRPPKEHLLHVSFVDVNPPTTTTIVLEQAGSQVYVPVTPPSSLSSSPTDSKHLSNATDSLLGIILNVVVSEDHLKDKWFNFGYELGLTVDQLESIESVCTTTIQCTRRVLCQWRISNPTMSWEPVAKSLAKTGLSELAHKLQDRVSQQDNDKKIHTHDKMPNGIYCSICDAYHLANVTEHSVNDVPSSIFNSAPSIADLNRLVGAKIQDKYHLFGTAVGLEEGYLNSLRVDYPTCQDRFSRLFDNWCEYNPDTFTWSTVIHVLRSNTINSNETAQQVIEYLTRTYPPS